MILTCDYEIDRKKNYAVRQVEQLDGEFYYPYQPLAVMSYKEKGYDLPEGKTQLI